MPKLLVVGAGGIGCELLKNLVLGGYHDLTVVDLDTIDLSNLNRQFLFRNRHIKQSKAVVASEVVAELTNEPVSIRAIHSNIIQDPQFDLAFYRQHDLVINCLDNLEARQHVNKMCIVTNRALVESGTAGLLGQASLHLPRVTDCFDCQERSNSGPKTYPICTIRSTPSAPIHCIVWAKSYLFPLLFGEGEDNQGTQSEGEDQAELLQLSKEAVELAQLKELLKTNTSSFVQQVFQKIFVKDVQRVAANVEMWDKPGRKCPVPIDVNSLQPLNYNKISNNAEAGADHQVWTLNKNYAVFVKTASSLSVRYQQEGELFFDKVDDDAMQFVTAASNLRSIIYHIAPIQSLFDAKQLAGNIIPAIASTNAVIAAYEMLLVDHFFRATSWVQLAQCARKSYLSYSSQYWITSEPLPKPNPNCNACSISKMTYQTLILNVNTKKTLSGIIDLVKTDMHGDLSVTRGSDILYDCDFDQLVERQITTFLGQESKQLVLTFTDEDQQYVPLQLFINFAEGTHKFATYGDKVQKVVKKRQLDESYPVQYSSKKAKAECIVVEDDDDCVIVQ